MRSRCTRLEDAFIRACGNVVRAQQLLAEENDPHISYTRVIVVAGTGADAPLLTKRRCSSNGPYAALGTGATMSPGMSLRRLVDLAKMRWRVERDYADPFRFGEAEGYAPHLKPLTWL